MAVTASVSVEGVNPLGKTNSAMPRVMPGGTATTGDRLIQWEAQLWTDGVTVPLITGGGILFTPWDHQLGLISGTQYTAKVRVQSQDWSWSPWVSATFTPDYTMPLPPQVAIFPVTHPTSGAPGMQAVISPAAALKDAANVRVDLQRHDPQFGWLEVDRVFKRPGYESADTEDWTMPSLGENQWRARVVTRDAFGKDVVGGWTYSPRMELDQENLSGWLVAQGHPHLSRRLVITSWSGATHELPVQITQPLSPLPRTLAGYLSHADRPQSTRVATGLRRRPKSSIQVRVHDQAELDALLELLSSGEKLMLRGHNEVGRDGKRVRRRDIWLKVSEDVVEDHYVQHAHQFRLVTFAYVEQDPGGAR